MSHELFKTMPISIFTNLRNHYLLICGNRQLTMPYHVTELEEYRDNKDSFFETETLLCFLKSKFHFNGFEETFLLSWPAFINYKKTCHYCTFYFALSCVSPTRTEQ